ncbi:MAG: hypothetical protein IJO50_03905, partial [Clostridia bacterium]|nr:hypothetical protein [Clostridia bacterium]
RLLGWIRTMLLVLLAQYFAFTAGPAQGISLLAGTFIAWDFTESYTPYRDAECTKQLFEYATMKEDMTLYLKEN